MSDEPGMAKSAGFSRREFVIGATLAGASVVGYAAQPKVVNARVANATFESWIPHTLGEWLLVGSSGVVLPPPDALADRLYDNVAARVYQMPNESAVMMVIAYNYRQDGVLQLHRPEFCYPAGGYSLSPTLPVTLALDGRREVPANAFTATGNNEIEQVLYFTRLGRSFPRSWSDQRMSVVWANLHGEIPDGAMMRVSVRDADSARSLELLRHFLQAFFDKAPPPLHRMLLGDPK